MTVVPAPSTSSDTAHLDNAFWRFSLSFYARAGIAPACLILQNRLGIDVNVLLLSIFAAVERRHILSADDLRSADDTVAAWRSAIVAQLRRIRTDLKSGPPPAPSAATEDLRSQVKAAELKAEQIEQAMLLAWLDHRRSSLSTPPPLDADELLQRITGHFCAELTEAPDAEVAAAMRTLSEAITHAARSG